MTIKTEPKVYEPDAADSQARDIARMELRIEAEKKQQSPRKPYLGSKPYKRH